MSEWTDKLRKDEKIISSLAGKYDYLIDFMELLEDNGFNIIGFNPGVSFYRKSALKKNKTYANRDSYSLDRRQSKVVWELIQKNHG